MGVRWRGEDGEGGGRRDEREGRGEVRTRGDDTEAGARAGGGKWEGRFSGRRERWNWREEEGKPNLYG